MTNCPVAYRIDLEKRIVNAKWEWNCLKDSKKWDYIATIRKGLCLERYRELQQEYKFDNGKYYHIWENK